MLSALFLNLREYTRIAKGADFTEDLSPLATINNLRDSEEQLFFSSFQELLDFQNTSSFAEKKKAKCTKGYPCGKSCIQSTKNCKNPIEGQAKTYAEFLELQNKLPKQTNKLKTESIKTKKASSNFESVDDPQEVNRLLTDLTKSNVYEAGEVWQDVLYARSTKDPEWIKDAEERFSKFGVTFSASESQLDDAQSLMLSIATAAVRQAKSTLPASEREELVKVIKANGKAASAVVYRKDADEITVEYLATSLENLTTQGGVKGAGTEAIASLVEEGINSGSGGKLKLYPLDGAISFYEKIGFKGYYDLKGDYSTDEMILEPEAAKAFLKKVRGK